MNQYKPNGDVKEVVINNDNNSSKSDRLAIISVSIISIVLLICITALLIIQGFFFIPANVQIVFYAFESIFGASILGLLGLGTKMHFSRKKKESELPEKYINSMMEATNRANQNIYQSEVIENQRLAMRPMNQQRPIQTYVHAIPNQQREPVIIPKK